VWQWRGEGIGGGRKLNRKLNWWRGTKGTEEEREEKEVT
jgi:hypothetical protein